MRALLHVARDGLARPKPCAPSADVWSLLLELYVGALDDVSDLGA